MRKGAPQAGRKGKANPRAGEIRALEALLEPWVARLEARSENTARAYRRAVEGFLEHVREEGLGSEAIPAYLRSLSQLAPASRAHVISAVRSFLRHAKDQGALDRSPEDYLVRPRVEVTSFGRYLDRRELQRLADAAGRLSVRHLTAVFGLALTGLRVSELTGAEWRDLFRDPKGRLGLRVKGKGGKERVVRVRGDLFSLLASLHGSRDLDARDQSPLLPDRRGTPYSPRGLHKLVAQAASEADLAKPVSPHWLRHTHATLAADGGAPAVVIQASLGHSRLETSQRYIHWARGLEKTTVDALPKLTRRRSR